MILISICVVLIVLPVLSDDLLFLHIVRDSFLFFFAFSPQIPPVPSCVFCLWVLLVVAC